MTVAYTPGCVSISNYVYNADGSGAIAEKVTQNKEIFTFYAGANLLKCMHVTSTMTLLEQYNL